MDQETAVQTGEPGTSVAHAGGTRALTQTGEQTAITSPAALIQYAIDNKLPAAELTALVDLHERMEDRIARRAYFEALRAFQRECPPIKKNRTAKIATKSGGGFSYTYAELDVIEPHIKPYLDKHGFAYTFDSETNDKGMLTNICILRHELGHSEQSRFTLPVANDGGASLQQKVGIADTYAKRRTLAAVLGLNITDKEAPESDLDEAKITDDQVTHIEDLIAETGADLARFLRYAQVDQIADILASDYKAIVSVLEQKKGKKP